MITLQRHVIAALDPSRSSRIALVADTPSHRTRLSVQTATLVRGERP